MQDKDDKEPGDSSDDLSDGHRNMIFGVLTIITGLAISLGYCFLFSDGGKVSIGLWWIFLGICQFMYGSYQAGKYQEMHGRPEEPSPVHQEPTVTQYPVTRPQEQGFDWGKALVFAWLFLALATLFWHLSR